jgi:predicted amino acid dehydrogenase
VFEAVYRAAKAKKFNLKKLNLAVIGATDSLSSLCAQKLAGYVGKIILADRNADKLEALKRKILDLNPAEVIIEEDVSRAIKDSDVSIIAAGPRQHSFDTEDFKPDSIVCYIVLSTDVDNKPKLGAKITFIEAGLVKLPSAPDFSITGVWPRDLISASFAETLLLAFEKRFVNYSWAENTSLDKLEEIADIAMRHGFEVWVPEAPVV